MEIKTRVVAEWVVLQVARKETLSPTIPLSLQPSITWLRRGALSGQSGETWQKIEIPEIGSMA